MADKYTYTIGRRKTSTVTLRLFEKAGKSVLNEKPLETTYSKRYERVVLLEPFKVANLNPAEYYYTVKAVGGGKMSQLDAIKLALSRAIIKLYPDKKKDMKGAGLLTRDPRMVERKKPGLRKARRAEQYSKR